MSFESNRRFQNFLNEKLHEVRQAEDSFIRTIATEDHSSKLTAANALIVKLNALAEGLAVNDHPSWLASLLSALKEFVNAVPNHASSLRIIQAIVANHPGLASQNWDYLADNGKRVVNIDLEANEVYDSSPMPGLFECLANQLEEIVVSGEIDSVRAIVRLQELIKLIRANMKAGYFSAAYLFGFAMKAIKNISLEFAKDKLGFVGAGIGTTIEEMNKEWPSVQQRVNDAIAEKLDRTIPSVDFLPLLSDSGASELIETLAAEQLRIEYIRPIEQDDKPQVFGVPKLH